MKYYFCVNCGYHGEFKFFRQRNIKCECCQYDAVTELDQEDWAEYGEKRHNTQDQDPYYKGLLKNERNR